MTFLIKGVGAFPDRNFYQNSDVTVDKATPDATLSIPKVAGRVGLEKRVTNLAYDPGNQTYGTVSQDLGLQDVDGALIVKGAPKGQREDNINFWSKMQRNYSRLSTVGKVAAVVATVAGIALIITKIVVTGGLALLGFAVVALILAIAASRRSETAGDQALKWERSPGELAALYRTDYYRALVTGQIQPDDQDPLVQDINAFYQKHFTVSPVPYQRSPYDNPYGK